MKKLFLISFFIVLKVACIAQTHQIGIGWGNFGWGYSKFERTFPNYQINYLFNYKILTATVDYMYVPNFKGSTLSVPSLHLGVQTNPNRPLIAGISSGAHFILIHNQKKSLLFKNQINPMLCINMIYKVSSRISFSLNLYESYLSDTYHDRHGISNSTYSATSITFTFSHKLFKPDN